jgi:hypothetical protein
MRIREFSSAPRGFATDFGSFASPLVSFAAFLGSCESQEGVPFPFCRIWDCDLTEELADEPVFSADCWNRGQA